MRAVERLCGLAAILLAPGCETPTLPLSPSEADLPYDFRLLLPVAVGDSAAADMFTFHWGLGATVPVLVMEASDPTRPSLAEALSDASAAWNRAAALGEVRLREAADPGRAGVLLVWADGPRAVRVPDDCVGPATSGAASTQGCIEEGRDEGGAPVKRLKRWPRADGDSTRIALVVTISSRPGTDAVRLRRLVTHEMGHALGILSHSPNPRDLMWSGLIPGDTLTRADRATLRALYHARRDLVPP
ncbi:MAG: hypothetical protein HY704_04615 [Gemmatimonadetes bacterium]|nr:hypothetical protein [Gemmatimonadota bacterium]